MAFFVLQANFYPLDPDPFLDLDPDPYRAQCGYRIRIPITINADPHKRCVSVIRYWYLYFFLCIEASIVHKCQTSRSANVRKNKIKKII